MLTNNTYGLTIGLSAFTFPGWEVFLTEGYTAFVSLSGLILVWLSIYAKVVELVAKRRAKKNLRRD